MAFMSRAIAENTHYDPITDGLLLTTHNAHLQSKPTYIQKLTKTHAPFFLFLILDWK